MTPEPGPTGRVPDVAAFDAAIRAHLDRMASLPYPDATIPVICTCDPWPPPVETTLAEGPVYGYSLNLSAFPDGHLAVTLDREDGTPPFRTEFQRITPCKGPSFVAWVTVKDGRVTLRIGALLDAYLPGQDPRDV